LPDSAPCHWKISHWHRALIQKATHISHFIRITLPQLNSVKQQTCPGFMWAWEVCWISIRAARRNTLKSGITL